MEASNTNIQRTIKNSFVSVVGQILSLLLQFINRRIFVMFLDIEYLGYQSVFGNIFSILSVAELGIGGIISFHLYKELATNNTREIGKLMYLYKWVYRIIAATVAALGLAACVFVPYIVKDATRSVGYLYVVYFMQLASNVAGYCFSYRRTILAADQKEYKCVQIDLYVHIALQVIQLSLLAIFKNYLVYLAVQLSMATVANIIIYIQTNREYPYLKEKYAVTREDIERRNLLPDVKNFLIHKIAYAVYGGTDNIVISAFCGIRDVALYGNYVLIRTGVLSVLFYRLLNPVQAAIGNIVYSDRDKDALWDQFEMFDVFSFFFASAIGAGFLVFFQPTVALWMGAQNLLPVSFVVVFSLTIYLGAVWEIVYKYRSVFGDYRQDRNCMLLSALLNIVISVALASRFGVMGVQLGTLAAYLPIAYGRVRFVVGRYFGRSVRKYLFKHACLFALVMLEFALLYALTSALPVNVGGLALRAVYWALVPTAINLLVYWRSPRFKALCDYLARVAGMVRSARTSKSKGATK